MKTQSTFIALEDIRIADPCRADWGMMQGDDRVRFCQTCAKNVYNLSAMTRSEAEELIREKEGKLCVRFYQREDGTILTDNCPVGLKIVRRPFKWLAASFVALLAAGGVIVRAENNKVSSPQSDQPNDVPTIVAPRKSLWDIQPFKMLYHHINPEQTVIQGAHNNLVT